LDPTIEKGILFRYSAVSKAYQIYIITLRIIVVRRDVIFKEDRAFQKSCELRERESRMSHRCRMIHPKGHNLRCLVHRVQG
jgi:hypothetical protein